MIDLTAIPELTATRVYAVGDIHGRLDLLLRMEQAIAADLSAHSTPSPVICCLGDYIDRGPASAGVLTHLAAPSPLGRRVCLRGNHEDRMLAFLQQPEKYGASWMMFGGVEALESYGIIPDGDWTYARDELLAAMPPEHLLFLQHLALAARWQTYLFVHAGLDPARPLRKQDPEALIWMREPFLSATTDFGLRVVHGHTIERTPMLRPNRIGLDTGAFSSGILSCAALEGEEVRILQVQ